MRDDRRRALVLPSAVTSAITESVQCNRINQDAPPPKVTMEAVVTLTSPTDIAKALVIVDVLDGGTVMRTGRGVAGPRQAGTPQTFHMHLPGSVPNGGWTE